MTKGKNTGAPYDIGYAKPPAGNQFKPGQSGNPGGRPKRTLHEDPIYNKWHHLLAKELSKKVAVKRRDGSTQKIPVAQAIVMRAIETGLTGGPKQLNELVKLIERAAQAHAEGHSDEPNFIIIRGGLPDNGNPLC